MNLRSKVIFFKKAEAIPVVDPDIANERRKLEDSRRRILAIKTRTMLRGRSTT